MSYEHINLSYQQLTSTGSISLQELSLGIGNRTLLENTNLIVSRGINYGIIGPNGHGKTTLLNAIAYKLDIKDFHIYMVKQEDSQSELNVIDEVLSSHVEYSNFISKELEIQNRINSDEIDDEELLELNEELEMIYEQARCSGLLSIKANASKILAGLGFEMNSSTGNWQEKKVNDFSGGWRMRISLSKALLNEPDLLILDEPTNHLDLNAVIWLGDYLQHWNTFKNTKQKSLLLVSHDEGFLDEVCHKIIRLDNQKIKTYTGNYKKMKGMVLQERIVELKEYDKKKKYIKSKKERKKLKPKHEYKVDFKFEEAIIRGKISLQNVVFDYDVSKNSKDSLIQNLNFNVETGDKFVIVGKNGVGKSTILKLLTGELNPVLGEKIITKNLHIGKYYQHFEDSLPMDKTPIEYLRSLFPGHELEEIRKHLSNFNLDSTSHTIQIGKCSGGQKSRIAFSSLCLADILVLDEPTNHLDLESIAGLSSALKQFSGGIVLVSHDAKLIRDLDCQIYICENGGLYKFEGDFDDYHDLVIRELEKESEQIDDKNKSIEDKKYNKKSEDESNLKIRQLFAKKKKIKNKNKNKNKIET
jgi:ATP-binding cassette, subfamily F, member 1